MMLDTALVKKTPGAIDVRQIFLEYQEVVGSSRGGESVSFIIAVALERSVAVEDDVPLQIIHFSVFAFELTIHPCMAVGGFGQIERGRVATEEELTNGATDVIHAAVIHSDMMVKSTWREKDKKSIFFRLLSSRKLLSFWIKGISSICPRRLRVADEKSK